ncbi:MAG: ATP-binding protein [Egibacteraceae bacterium]
MRTLTEPENKRAVRRVVTVVFTDIAGSTELAERSDPEQLRRVMSRYFAEMRMVVERHGGTVGKFVGDAVMAVFGIPQAHEDDALRAVRAAAEMRDALEPLNKDLQRDWGITVRARTGVNTGEVVTDHGDVGGALVVGDAVNVAARLEQAASSQEILLGEDTYRLVKGAVKVEPLKPLAVKGKSNRLRVFRLLRIVPGVHTTPTRRLDTPLVGRGEELDALRQVFEQVVSQQACQLFTLLGVAGVGKSRLAAEFVASVDDEATVLQGHCLSYGEGITFWPVAEIVKQVAGVSDDDSSQGAQAKLLRLLQGEDEAPLIVERVGQLVGFVQATVASDEILWGVRKLLEALARRQAVVVVFEDLHWAEPTFLDLIDHITDWSRHAPVLVLCLARPDLLAQRPSWGEGKANASSLELGPLSEQDSQQFMENLLGRRTLAGRVRARISETAEGNPLYLEEILSMLIDNGLLTEANGQWVATANLREIRLPPTIQGLLATRLDRLDTDERQIIEAASAVGTVFSQEALVELLPESLGRRVEPLLTTLVAKKLANPHPSNGRERVFRFHHALIRDAAYNATSKLGRAQLHERVADWLERTAGERIGEHEEILGYHLESAYRYGKDLRPPDAHARGLAWRAAERLSTAGIRALARGDMGAAANLLSRAVALLPAHDQRRLSLLPNLAEALMSTGELEDAEVTLAEALEAATSSGNVQLRAHLLLARSMQRLFTNQQGGAEEARREAVNAIPIFEAAGDELGLARSWRLLSVVHLAFAHFSAAEDAMDRAATYARRTGDRQEELDCLFWLPLPLWAGPTTPERGIRRCEEILRRADGDRKVKASVLFARGAFEAMRGRFRESSELLTLARAILEDLGLRVWIAGPWSQFYGWAKLLAGDFAAAESELRSGYEALARMGESAWCSSVAALLAKTTFAQGHYAEAERFTTISEEMAGETDIYTHVLVRGIRGKAIAIRGDFEEGERLSREAVSLAAQTDFLQVRGEAHMDLAEVLHLAGRLPEAKAMFEDAQYIYDRKGNTTSSENARQKVIQLIDKIHDIK